MKKSIVALFLAVGFLLPACNFEIMGGEDSTDSSSVLVEGEGGEPTNPSSPNEGETAEKHVDANDDGICDDCRTNVCVTVDLFSVNDLHGKFKDTSAQPGVDELSTYFQQARAKNPNTVLLSSGDMWQGSSESNLTRGRLITDWMNEMGFASMTLGNHEYDWGEDAILENVAMAEFPMLAINVYEESTNQRVTYCDASVTVELGEITVGIIGAIGNCYSSISSDMTKGIYFKTGTALTSLVKAEANRLRQQEGVDFIVYSLHDDETEYDVTLSTGGYVDIVFEGHTHQSYAQKDGGGVYHVQGGGDNDGISRAVVTVNSVTGTSSVQTAQYLSSSAYASLADHPIVNTLMTKYQEEISAADVDLGYNCRLRKSNEILNLCAQLYIEKGLERWGDAYQNQIVLGGGFMSVRAPYELVAGRIKYGDLMNVLPFDNELVLCKIKGIDLKNNFIHTTNDRYYVAYSAYGNSVKNNVNDSQYYYVVTDTYSSTYAPNRLTEIERFGAGTYARDLLAEYVKKGGFAS